MQRSQMHKKFYFALLLATGVTVIVSLFRSCIDCYEVTVTVYLLMAKTVFGKYSLYFSFILLPLAV